MRPRCDLDLHRIHRTLHILACSTLIELQPKVLDLRRDSANPCEAMKADDGARTRDLRLGKPTLYQLSYVRKCAEMLAIGGLTIWIAARAGLGGGRGSRTWLVCNEPGGRHSVNATVCGNPGGVLPLSSHGGRRPQDLVLRSASAERTRVGGRGGFERNVRLRARPSANLSRRSTDRRSRSGRTATGRRSPSAVGHAPAGRC